MAAPVTVLDNRLSVEGVQMITLKTTLTQDSDVFFDLPRGVTAMSISVTGTFGSGTVTIQASNDRTNYFALPTAVSFSTSAALKSVATADLGSVNFNIHLSGSTSPSLVVTVSMNVIPILR